MLAWPSQLVSSWRRSSARWGWLGYRLGIERLERALAPAPDKQGAVIEADLIDGVLVGLTNLR